MPKPRKVKSVTVTMEHFSDHKKVVRFNCDDEDAALASAYVNNDALAKLGNPDTIKVTIEAA